MILSTSKEFERVRAGVPTLARIEGVEGGRGRDPEILGPLRQSRAGEDACAKLAAKFGGAASVKEVSSSRRCLKIS
jgi:hypothetical protein